MKKVLWFIFPVAAALRPDRVLATTAVAAVAILASIVIDAKKKEVANL